MGRVRKAQIWAATLGASLWAVALLLPQAPEALAQTALFGHFAGQSGVGSAAVVRQAIKDDQSMQRELECLALNVYWESRGEPLRGRQAIAAVTLNRTASSAFPGSICQVVWQGAALGMHRCQFSWACDGRGNKPRNRTAWNEAVRVANEALLQDFPDPTGGALYFHATHVRPRWSHSFVKMGQIGRHIFYGVPYRPKDDISVVALPSWMEGAQN